MVWILLVLVYGILKGFRDICKKKALLKNKVVEVLLVYTALAFLMVTPEIPKAGGVPAKEMLLIAFKSFIIFVAFLCSFYAIEKMPISLYGILDLSRMLFAELLGVIILNETLSVKQIVGLFLVSFGLIMLKYKPKAKKRSDSEITGERSYERVEVYIVVLAFISTILNAVSGIMDKILTRTVTDGQLQFWYMFYMLIYYILYVLFTKTKINWKSVLSNPYVYAISIMFVLADRALFIANCDPNSKVTIMTLIKQSCCIVTIFGGWLIFKEKNIRYKLLCAAVVVSGIVVSIV